MHLTTFLQLQGNIRFEFEACCHRKEDQSWYSCQEIARKREGCKVSHYEQEKQKLSHVFVNVSSLYLILSQRKKNSVLFSQSFEKEWVADESGRGCVGTCEIRLWQSQGSGWQCSKRWWNIIGKKERASKGSWCHKTHSCSTGNMFITDNF